MAEAGEHGPPEHSRSVAVRIPGAYQGLFQLELKVLVHTVVTVLHGTSGNAQGLSLVSDGVFSTL